MLLVTVTKFRVYLALVQSVLLYASETWTLTIADSKSLGAFRMKCERRILGISWHQFVRNEAVAALVVCQPCGPSSLADVQPSLDTQRGSARVRPVHTMNAEQCQMAADLWTKPKDLSHRPPCRQLGNYIHHRHLLLLSLKDAHFTIPQRVEG